MARLTHPITGCHHGQLLGVWAILPDVHVSLYNLCMSFSDQRLSAMAEESRSRPAPVPYIMHEHGVAEILMDGPITKHPTSFDSEIGGGSTIRAKASLRQAVRDPNVDRVLFHIDESPGGTGSGTFDLADAVRQADGIKPIYTHFSDQAASAAYLAGSAGRRITANSNAMVGGIGAYTVLKDTSQINKDRGIKLYVISSGGVKGVGADGEITPEIREEVQRMVNDSASLFNDYVSKGRRLSLEETKQLADGRVHISSKAKELKLIDDVANYDDVLHELQSKSPRVFDFRGSTHTGGTLAASAVGTIPTRSNAMAFNAEQIRKARQLPGAANVPEEQLENTVLDVASSLQQQIQQLQTQLNAQPKPMDENLARAMANLARKEVDLLFKDGKILGEQATYLKNWIQPENGTPNMAAFVSGPGGKMLYEQVLGAFELNKAHELDKKLSGAQPVQRTEPGGEEQKTERPSLARVNEVRVQRGFPALTQQEYELRGMGAIGNA